MIITRRLKIRKWADRDIASLPSIANDEVMAGRMRDSFPYPYTNKDAREWLDYTRKVVSDLHLAIDKDDKLVGSIAAVFKSDVHRKNIEIGYWVAEPYRGQGIAKEAISAFLDYLFGNYEHHRIYAGIFSNNKISMNLLEKLGFSCEAILKQNVYKRGEYLDEHIYSITRKQYEGNVKTISSRSESN